MRDSIEMPKGTFYTIAAICAVTIMFTSLEMLIKAKDTSLFNMWLSNGNLGEDLLTQTTNQLYSTYLNICIATFFVRVITPIAVLIHSYFTFTRLRVNKLFVMIWSVVLVGAFALTILTEKFYSILFIGSGIGYLALALTMIYLWKCLSNIRSI
ncbi:hypothetical protein [Clostridium sp.]|jgi:hypothetical protein|uniref:hypothetical protein n=1 Tax=Clostridium sp. TaxID=1506 RepID=UPI0025C3724E|nr:hypothetical protein [Clostridium sp.]MCI9070348.1 hypothetical protein [Clostridium sp.]MCI9302943.1 hypothetical protein [Clostridium sp.]